MGTIYYYIIQGYKFAEGKQIVLYLELFNAHPNNNWSRSQKIILKSLKGHQWACPLLDVNLFIIYNTSCIEANQGLKKQIFWKFNHTVQFVELDKIISHLSRWQF